MIKARVIPVLLLKGRGLYKGTKFKNEKYVGDPINTLRIFNEKEVDEIVVLDIEASQKGRSPDLGFINELASECFMPMCYGGGISSISEIEKIFYAGVEKVSLNSHGLTNPAFIRSVASVFGSQSLICSIDVKKNMFGKQNVYTHRATRKVSGSPLELAQCMEEAGAGEILLTSVDREGSGTGYDLDLIHEIASNISIPVVAAGGASQLSHFKEAVTAGASAVSAGDMFTFYGKHKAVLIQYPKIADLEQALS